MNGSMTTSTRFALVHGLDPKYPPPSNSGIRNPETRNPETEQRANEQGANREIGRVTQSVLADFLEPNVDSGTRHSSNCWRRVMVRHSGASALFCPFGGFDSRFKTQDL
jgi:hypothetical protein